MSGDYDHLDDLRSSIRHTLARYRSDATVSPELGLLGDNFGSGVRASTSPLRPECEAPQQQQQHQPLALSELQVTDSGMHHLLLGDAPVDHLLLRSCHRNMFPGAAAATSLSENAHTFQHQQTDKGSGLGTPTATNLNSSISEPAAVGPAQFGVCAPFNSA